jgi:geranylgeranyl pyrophosphate synthase
MHDAIHALHALVADDVLPDAAFDGFSDDDEVDRFERGPEVPRIRPILVVLAARAAGQCSDADLQRAAELLHRALAVHDVALGREGGRRRRVARKLMRRSASWLGGNQLTLRAIELAQAARPDVLGDLLETVREFADGHELMAELQSGRVPTREDWLEHADRHTGALFAFCCRVGAKTSADRHTPEALARYGRHLGRLWHVAEDVAVLEREEFTPALVARAMAGRPLLPVAIAAERNASIGRLWSQLVHHPSDGTAAWLAQLVDDAGGLVGARERMLTESWSARQALAEIPASHHRTALERLVHTVAVASIRRP